VLVSVVHLEGDEETVDVSRWDVERSAQRASFRPGASSPFALSPDGMTLAWTVQGRPSGVWTANLETQERRLIANPGSSAATRWSSRPTAGSSPPSITPAGVRSPTCPYIYVFDAHSGRILLRSPRPFDAPRPGDLHDGRLLARAASTAASSCGDLKAAEESANVSGPASKTEGAEMLVFRPTTGRSSRRPPRHSAALGSEAGGRARPAARHKSNRSGLWPIRP
jgi:hypothetical protein